MSGIQSVFCNWVTSDIGGSFGKPKLFHVKANRFYRDTVKLRLGHKADLAGLPWRRTKAALDDWKGNVCRTILAGMGNFISPALARFWDALGEEMVVAQVHIARQAPEGVVLRHVADTQEHSGKLSPVAVGALRELVQKNAEGGFRPLSASPDLPRGWCCPVQSAEELEQALESIYPGFLADWHAVHTGTATPTDYFTFTQRQSGMYRLTAKATAEQAGAIVQACCAARFCLKQRLWTVPGLARDRQEDKSMIPCLEPCALLLEFARKRMRISQEAPVALTLAPTEIRGLLAALDLALHRPHPQLRVADFNAPANSRHLEWLRQKLSAALASSSVSAAPVAEGKED